MAKTTSKRTYYPAKTFDDDLTNLTQLFTEKKWAFSGVDLAQLAKDSTEQRTERQVHDTLESKYLNVHETFGVSQEARHRRLSSPAREPPSR